MPFFRERAATGWEISFLVFTVALLAVPGTTWLMSTTGSSPEFEPLVSRALIFGVPIAAIVGIKPLRFAAINYLRQPIAPGRRVDVLWGSLLCILGNFASAGAVALLIWMQGGQEAMISRLQIHGDQALADSLTLASLLMLPVAWLIGPAFEELVFRGFMFHAFARRLHWIVAMLVTAVMFGIYHPMFVSAFLGSILFTCVMRRTGSLRSAIVTHAVGNAALWYPLLGRFVFPTDAGEDIGRFATWWLQLGCLAAFMIALPIYAWMARDYRMAMHIPEADSAATSV